jgi:membrane associated rhomboid family serine protease
MSEKRKLIHAIIFPLFFLVIMWVTYAVFHITQTNMSLLGVKPLSLGGLCGIVCSPFAHGGIKHIVSNSISFFILASLLFYFYRYISYRVFFLNWIISGTLLWLGGRDVTHIGASGIVYGLAFFIFFSGFFKREKSLKAVSFIVIIFYGGMVWGMMPMNNNISWEGHLFGAMSGLSLAWYYRKYNDDDMLRIKQDSEISTTWGNDKYIMYEYIEED